MEDKLKEDNSSREIEIRKKKIIGFFKEKKELVYYPILALIISLSLYIRTRNIPKLKDITTGTWTLGPDLDPFLFLRWAKYIGEHGKLFLLDNMRYVPLAEICSGAQCNPVNTAFEMKFLSYMIAGFHKFLIFLFGKSEITITYSAVIFPVVMFGLTLVAFFMLSRKIFYKEEANTKNIIALVSTALLAFMPSLLPRTIAGIPEKESAAFFFIFLSLYLFLESYTSSKFGGSLIFGALAGISTGIAALTWGGAVFIFVTIAVSVLFFFLLGEMNGKRICAFGIWIISFILTATPLSIRYSLENLVVSSSTGLIFLTFFIIIFDFIIYEKKVFGISEKIKKINLPRQVISLIFGGAIIVILASVIFGISFIPKQVSEIIDQTVHPLTLGRFSVTVAENKQPYFQGEWKSEFGPVVFNIPLYFWLFFIGSIALFNNMIKPLEKKEKLFLTFSYFIFFISLIFSKNSPSGLLNGDSNMSLIVYFGGVLFFVLSFGYFYYKRYKKGEGGIFGNFEFSYLLYFIALTLAIISARGAIRLIMVLGAISPIAVGFLAVKFPKDYLKEKEETKKLFIGIVALIILVASIFTINTYYKQSLGTAEGYAPGAYQWQWQKAMAWVRENTPKTAVFGHWWDYGYWLQSIGERATILDGGNAVGYWNHLMGRYALTGEDEKSALEFLYAHNGTHFLIDSTDIGKYPAFSSIGSNENYDRYSWIATFLIDEKQTQETNNETIYIYQGGTAIDDDIIWEKDGEEIFLPRKRAGIGAVILKVSKNNELGQPQGVFVYDEKQYMIPLRFIYFNGKLIDFGSGIKSGIFLFPKIQQNSNSQYNINFLGASLYLGARTVRSNLAKLYLFNENSEYFKLVHSEDSLVVEDLKRQGMTNEEFVYFNGFHGPIKIWEINYPKDMKLNESYLNTDYPAELATVIPGEY